MEENKKPLFPLYWTEEHYRRSLSLKELEIGFLEEEDQQSFKNRCAFVQQGDTNPLQGCLGGISSRSGDMLM
jgi:hypothetical protein